MGMKHQIHHGLDLDLARLALDKAMAAYSARFADYSPHFAWASQTRGKFGFKAGGMAITGELDIVGDHVDVELEVPFLLRIWKGKAMDVIDSEMKKWIAKARNGELESE